MLLPSASLRLVAGYLLAAVSSLPAATISSSASFTLNHGVTVTTGSASILGTTSNTASTGPATVTLPQFNSAAGTLNSVSITIATTGSTAGVSETGLLSLISGASYTSLLRADVTAGSVTRTGQHTATTNSLSLLGLLTLSGTQQANGASLNTTFTITDPTETAAFVGSGNFSTAFTTSDSASVSTTVSIFNGAGMVASGTYSGQVEVTYTYTPPVVITAPSIAVAPTPIAVAAGATATFTVTAGGSAPFTYQWLKDGIAIAGASNSSLVLNSVQLSDAGTYSVNVSGPGGSVTSSGAVLTVSPLTVAPHITSQPAGLTVSSGGALTLAVTATGTGPLSYQWYKNGAAVSGASASSLVFAAAVVGDSGNYHVVVTNSAGSATSSAAVVVVSAVAPVTTPPAIGTPPAAQSATVGSSVTFTVSASGTAPFAYQWLKNGVSIAGAINSSLNLNPVQLSDAGVYSVTISGPGGTVTSTGASLTVNPAAVPATAPQITSHPTGLTLSAGGTLNLSVVAAGTAPFSYQWQKNGAAISGASSSTLTIASASVGDSGSYHVTVNNSAGTATSLSAVVVVSAAPSATTPPTIGAPPAAQTATVGSSVTFSVSVSGSAPFTYQWSKNGSSILGATNSSLHFNSVQLSDAGTYSVTVSGPGGTATSPGALLAVNPAVIVPTVPVIGNQPTGVTVSSGGSFTLTVGASSTAPLGYQWHKDGVALSGATTSSFTIANATAADSGTYHVLISTSAGSATSAPAVVSVLPVAPANTAPVITSQPVSQTLTEGSSLTLSVSATGSAPFTYQWHKDGAAVSGATQATFTRSAITPTDSGAYRVAVSNTAGTATSTSAQIVVQASNNGNGGGSSPGGNNPPPSDNPGTGGGGGSSGNLPPLTAPPISKTVAVGATVTFDVPSPGAGYTFQWLKNGAAILGATNLKLTLLNVQPSDSGEYSLLIQNEFGSVTTTAATLLVEGSPSSAAAAPGRLVNLSTRSHVGAGDHVLIGGFVIGGTTAQTLLIRAVGPSLEKLGLDGVLADPKLTIYRGDKAIMANNDWMSADVILSVLQMSQTAGAFPLDTGAKDAAMVASLEPGAYTVVVEGHDDVTGIGLIELYNVTTRHSTALGNDIINLSSRGLVGEGHKVVIAGFIVGGNSPRTMLIRGVGPSLAALGVANALSDPKLTIYRDGTIIKENNDWSVGNDPAAVRRVSRNVGAFALQENSRDAVMLITLEPGTYTAVTSSNSDQEGVALVEIYEVP